MTQQIDYFSQLAAKAESAQLKDAKLVERLLTGEEPFAVLENVNDYDLYDLFRAGLGSLLQFLAAEHNFPLIDLDGTIGLQDVREYGIVVAALRKVYYERTGVWEPSDTCMAYFDRKKAKGNA